MGSYNATVIVTSDSCFHDPASDESGPYVVDQLERTDLFAQVRKQIVPDEMALIVESIKSSLSFHDPALIITIGGTGLCPRDVTPEATSSLYDRDCTGISTGLHMVGLRYAPHAALSRLTSGIIAGTLVVNFPGKLRACKDYMPWLTTILEHALEQVRFNFQAYTETHKKQQQQQQQQRELQVDSESQSIHPDDSASNAPSTLSTTNSRANGLARDLAAFKLTGAPAVPSPKPVVRKNGVVPKRGPTPAPMPKPASCSGKITIEAIMESRSEFPIVDTQSEMGGDTRHKKGFAKAPSSVRSLKSKITSSLKPKAAPQQTNGLSTSTNLPKTKIMPLESQFPLMDFKQALDILSTMSEHVIGGEPEEIKLTTHSKAYGCLGYVLARDLTPKRLVPPYNVSTMDGYVLNIPPSLKGVIAKGEIKTLPPARLVADLEHFVAEQLRNKDNFICYQINTGGRLPVYNYAVVPVERTGPVANGTVPIYEVKQGAFVRRKGSDVGEEDCLLAGTIIGPVELSVIMAMGHKSILVYQRPRIGVLSTGDELEDYFDSASQVDGDGGTGATPSDHIVTLPVIDTNGPLLTLLFRRLNFFTVNLGVARDDPDDICAKLELGLRKCDVVLVTGGASMGSRDHVKSVIAHLGGTIHFGRINMKPGKPVAFASLQAHGRRKFIFSLPGNPVSAYVTTTVLVMPFIQHGLKNFKRPGSQISFDSVGDLIEAEICELQDGATYYIEGRLEFLRAKIVARKPAGKATRPLYTVRVSVKQQSSRMLNLVNCDCLILIDPELKGTQLKVGTRYPALRLPRQN